jgi:hypothetical protein
MPWLRHSARVQPPQIPATTIPGIGSSRPAQTIIPPASATQSSRSFGRARAGAGWLLCCRPQGCCRKPLPCMAHIRLTSASEQTRRTVTPAGRGMSTARGRASPIITDDVTGDEGVSAEDRRQVGDSIVAASLPLHLGDVRVTAEVVDGCLHQHGHGRGVSRQLPVGDESSPCRVGRPNQRAMPLPGQGRRHFRFVAELAVINRKQGGGIEHDVQYGRSGSSALLDIRTSPPQLSGER